jgi:hypothetical protein
MVLIPTGRSSATDHGRADYRIEPLRANQPARLPRLPVAALPAYEGEVRTVYRAKRRPALIISTGGPDVPQDLRAGSPRWQTAPTLLVAPYYGADRKGRRAGFPEALVSRIRRCEYPQFIWDRLPLAGETEASLLRLDHIQPLGRHHASYELTEHCLSAEAMLILDEWLHWLLEDDLPEESVLYDFRQGLLNLEVCK